MKEILQEEDVGQPWGSFDCLSYGGADKPRRVEIDGDQYEQVDGPDTQSTAAIEVAEVVRLVACLKKDGCDEEAGEDEKEIDACPSPETGVVDPCAFETRMAVVNYDGKDGEAAQAL